MARPEKNTVDYFSHDASASNGVTLTIVQNKYGNDGYSFWFKLLEHLCNSDNHYINCNDTAQWQFLLAKTRVDEVIAINILDTLCSLQAIDGTLWKDKIIWCQKLVDRIAIVYRNRNRLPPRKPIYTDGYIIFKPIEPDIPTTHNPVSTTVIEQSKVKETIVNNTIVNKEAKKDGKLDLSDYINNFLKPKYPELNVKEEIEKCDTWWSEGRKKMTRPKTAYRNWLDRAMKYKNNGVPKEVKPVKQYGEVFRT